MPKKQNRIKETAIATGLLEAGEDCAPYDIEFVITTKGIEMRVDTGAVLQATWDEIDIARKALAKGKTG